MTIDYDQLALEVAAKVYGVPLTGGAITRMKEFARRYRVALKEKMKPYAYAGMNIDMYEEMVTFFKKDLDKHLKIVTPLYSLKDW